MYHIPKSNEPNIDEPHVIGVFVGGSATPTMTSQDDVASCVYNAYFCGAGLTVGALCSANVKISAYGRHELSGQDVVVKLGFGAPLEWIQLGVFRVCECQVGDDTSNITAYDAAYWATGGDYIPTVQTPTSVRAVLEDVCEQCNITLGALPSAADRVIDGRLTGYTARQIIMHMATVCGCNAIIDRSGALRLKWLSDNGQAIGPDDYYADELANTATINIVGVQMKTKIITPSTDPDSGITVEREEEKTYSSASGTGRVLAVDCPYANQDLVDAIADAVVPLSYSVGSVSFIGGYDVEPGDILTVTPLSGAVHSVPVLGLTLSLDGGCRATVKAEGYSDTDTRANFDTEYQQALSRIEADIIAVKNLTAENFEAQTAYIQNLTADKATVHELSVVADDMASLHMGVDGLATRVSAAQLTANNKRRVFVSTPVPPYDVGDLWTNGTDLLTCVGARAAGTPYLAADWVKKVSYTDDTAANEAKKSVSELKVEVSGIATRVQSAEGAVSALQQTANSLTTRVSTTESVANSARDKLDNLSIGGRNLLLNSSFANNFSKWSNWGSPEIREVIPGQDARMWAHIKTSGVAFQGVQQNSNVNGALVNPDDYYTISFTAYAPEAGTTMAVGVHWNDIDNAIIAQSWQVFVLSAKPRRYSYTISPRNRPEITKINFMIGDNTTDLKEFFFGDVQLEQGSIATDWTPSPEDIESRMDAAESSISQTAKEIALTVKKDGVISSINQTAEKILIDAQKVAFTGKVEGVDMELSGTLKGVNLNGTTGNFKEAVEVWAADGYHMGKLRLDLEGPDSLSGGYWAENVADEQPVKGSWFTYSPHMEKTPRISTGAASFDFIVAPKFYGAALYESPHVDAGFISGDDVCAQNLYAHDFKAYSGEFNGNLIVNGNINGHSDSDYLRSRDSQTGSGGASHYDTLWNQIGIQQYNNALPDGLADSETYTYGAAVSLPGTQARLDLWYNHRTSINGEGLRYRTGWRDDKKSWATILDTLSVRNYIQRGSVSVSPVGANVVTAVDIAFSKAFAAKPVVFVSPISSAPGSVFAVVNNVSETGFTLHFKRADATKTWVDWFAVSL